MAGQFPDRALRLTVTSDYAVIRSQSAKYQWSFQLPISGLLARTNFRFGGIPTLRVLNRSAELQQLPSGHSLVTPTISSKRVYLARRMRKNGSRIGYVGYTISYEIRVGMSFSL